MLSKDWGFYYTVTTNLKKTDRYVDKCEGLTDDDRKDIKSKIAELLDRIEKAPKSTGWKMRASIGAKKKWYRDVEEVHETI